MVVLLDEAVEALLLLQQCRGGRAGRLGLEDPVHPFVLPVLLRMRRLYALGPDTQTQPTNRESAETEHALARERHAVVGADDLRQAVASESSFEHQLSAVAANALQSFTAKQVAAVTVTD